MIYASHTVGREVQVEIELWLDYICPYSRKLFDCVYSQVIPEVEAQYPGRVSWTFNHQVQPWHPQGAILHEYAIAVGIESPERFWQFSKALFDESPRFYDEAVVDKSRNDLLSALGEIAGRVGVDHSRILQSVNITAGTPANRGSPTIAHLKHYVKLGRQNGIHVSPTAVTNGLVDNSISSSWTTREWVTHIEGLLDN